MNTLERKNVTQRQKIFSKVDSIVGKLTTRDIYSANTVAIDFNIGNDLFFYIIKTRGSLANSQTRILNVKDFENLTLRMMEMDATGRIISTNLNSLDAKMFAREIRAIEDFKKVRQVKLDD